MCSHGDANQALHVVRKSYGYVQESRFRHLDIYHEEVDETDACSLWAPPVKCDTRTLTYVMTGDQNAGKSTLLHALSHSEAPSFLRMHSYFPSLSASFVNARLVPPGVTPCDEGPFLDTDVARARAQVTVDAFLFFCEEAGLSCDLDYWGITQDTRYISLQLIELGGDHLDRLMFSQLSRDQMQPFMQPQPHSPASTTTTTTTATAAYGTAHSPLVAAPQLLSTPCPPRLRAVPVRFPYWASLPLLHRHAAHRPLHNRPLPVPTSTAAASVAGTLARNDSARLIDSSATQPLPRSVESDVTTHQDTSTSSSSSSNASPFDDPSLHLSEMLLRSSTLVKYAGHTVYFASLDTLLLHTNTDIDDDEPAVATTTNDTQMHTDTCTATSPSPGLPSGSAALSPQPPISTKQLSTASLTSSATAPPSSSPLCVVSPHALALLLARMDYLTSPHGHDDSHLNDIDGDSSNIAVAGTSTDQVQTASATSSCPSVSAHLTHVSHTCRDKNVITLFLSRPPMHMQPPENFDTVKFTAEKQFDLEGEFAIEDEFAVQRANISVGDGNDIKKSTQTYHYNDEQSKRIMDKVKTLAHRVDHLSGDELHRLVFRRHIEELQQITGLSIWELSHIFSDRKKRDSGKFASETSRAVTSILCAAFAEGKEAGKQELRVAVNGQRRVGSMREEKRERSAEAALGGDMRDDDEVNGHDDGNNDEDADDGDYDFEEEEDHVYGVEASNNDNDNDFGYNDSNYAHLNDSDNEDEMIIDPEIQPPPRAWAFLDLGKTLFSLSEATFKNLNSGEVENDVVSYLFPLHVRLILRKILHELSCMSQNRQDNPQEDTIAESQDENPGKEERFPSSLFVDQVFDKIASTCVNTIIRHCIFPSHASSSTDASASASASTSAMASTFTSSSSLPHPCALILAPLDVCVGWLVQSLLTLLQWPEAVFTQYMQRSQQDTQHTLGISSRASHIASRPSTSTSTSTTTSTATPLSLSTSIGCCPSCVFTIATSYLQLLRPVANTHFRQQDSVYAQDPLLSIHDHGVHDPNVHELSLHGCSTHNHSQDTTRPGQCREGAKHSGCHNSAVHSEGRDPPCDNTLKRSPVARRHVEDEGQPCGGGVSHDQGKEHGNLHAHADTDSVYPHQQRLPYSSASCCSPLSPLALLYSHARSRLHAAQLTLSSRALLSSLITILRFPPQPTTHTYIPALADTGAHAGMQMQADVQAYMHARDVASAVASNIVSCCMEHGGEVSLEAEGRVRPEGGDVAARYGGHVSEASRESYETESVQMYINRLDFLHYLEENPQEQASDLGKLRAFPEIAWELRNSGHALIHARENKSFLHVVLQIDGKSFFWSPFLDLWECKDDAVMEGTQNDDCADTGSSAVGGDAHGHAGVDDIVGGGNDCHDCRQQLLKTLTTLYSTPRHTLHSHAGNADTGKNDSKHSSAGGYRSNIHKHEDVRSDIGAMPSLLYALSCAGLVDIARHTCTLKTAVIDTNISSSATQNSDIGATNTGVGMSRAGDGAYSVAINTQTTVGAPGTDVDAATTPAFVIPMDTPAQVPAAGGGEDSRGTSVAKPEMAGVGRYNLGKTEISGKTEIPELGNVSLLDACVCLSSALVLLGDGSGTRVANGDDRSRKDGDDVNAAANENDSSGFSAFSCSSAASYSPSTTLARSLQSYANALLEMHMHTCAPLRVLAHTTATAAPATATAVGPTLTAAVPSSSPPVFLSSTHASPAMALGAVSMASESSSTSSISPDRVSRPTVCSTSPSAVLRSLASPATHVLFDCVHALCHHIIKHALPHSPNDMKLYAYMYACIVLLLTNPKWLQYMRLLFTEPLLRLPTTSAIYNMLFSLATEGLDDSYWVHTQRQAILDNKIYQNCRHDSERQNVDWSSLLIRNMNTVISTSSVAASGNTVVEDTSFGSHSKKSVVNSVICDGTMESPSTSIDVATLTQHMPILGKSNAPSQEIPNHVNSGKISDFSRISCSHCVFGEYGAMLLPSVLHGLERHVQQTICSGADTDALSSSGMASVPVTASCVHASSTSSTSSPLRSPAASSSPSHSSLLHSIITEAHGQQRSVLSRVWHTCERDIVGKLDKIARVGAEKTKMNEVSMEEWRKAGVNVQKQGSQEADVDYTEGYIEEEANADNTDDQVDSEEAVDVAYCTRILDNIIFRMEDLFAFAQSLACAAPMIYQKYRRNPAFTALLSTIGGLDGDLGLGGVETPISIDFESKWTPKQVQSVTSSLVRAGWHEVPSMLQSDTRNIGINMLNAHIVVRIDTSDRRAMNMNANDTNQY